MLLLCCPPAARLPACLRTRPAELYGADNAARARLTFDIYPPEGSAASGGIHSSGKEQAQFVLNWRIPG